LRARSDANAAVLHAWIARTPWIGHLAVDPATRSNTSVCMCFADTALTSRGRAAEARVGQAMVALLAEEGVAYDIGAYRTAPPGLRIWCGATVETRDLEQLTPWLDWAYEQAYAALT
jgi:phosphoserine aminotransferase